MILLESAFENKGVFYMSKTMTLEANVDQILSNLPTGSLSRAISDNLYGINARHKNSPLPRPRDSHGYTFATRPQLNLTDMNISNSRRFFSMLTRDVFSYQMYTRLMLDPRLSYMGMASPLVNPKSAWIPIITNSITSISGWPDLVLPTYTSAPGLYNERMIWTDGVANHYEDFDLSISFKNTRGNPLVYLLTMWVYYQSLVYEGILNPYIDMVTENEIDYMTRIYRITTDLSNRYVSNIFATGGSFPINVPIGSLADYNTEKPYNESLTEINVVFRSVGFMFNEDIIKLEFNQTQAIFDPEIAKILEHDMTSTDEDAVKRSDPTKFYYQDSWEYAKVPHSLVADSEGSMLNNSFYNLNYNLIPYINLETSELEWFVEKRLLGIK